MAQTLLAAYLPQLVEEIAALLDHSGTADLVSQLSTLPIEDRCRCGDDFCATIYTACKSDRNYGIYECIPLEPRQGLLILDLRDRRIVSIEVLYRDEVRQKLIKLLP